MHRLPKIFSHSSNHRKAGADPGSGAGSSASHKASKPKPRLKRLDAMKNVDFDFLPSSASASSSSSYYSSEESVRTRLLTLYDGKTSFRLGGVDGEIEIICQSLGFSGIDDFGIPTDEYEAMKVRSSFASVTDRKIEVNCREIVASSGDDGGIGAVDAVCRDIEGNDEYVRLAESCDDLISKKSEEGRDLGDIDRNSAEDFNSRLVNSSRTSDAKLSDNASGRFNELRGKGIKGVRPPVLSPPPSMSLPVVDNHCTTWDIFRAFGPEGDASASKFERSLWFHVDGGLKRSEDEEHEDRRRRAMGREGNHALSRSCSFTTTSYDDDSSSTATDPMSSISPNGKCRRVILEWQKGELLGRGSFGSVYKGISDDGFFFAVKEVSLLDQGEEGKQRIIQLGQEIALLSQFEHENIVQYYGTKKDESHLYIFLELVTIGSLLSLYQIYTLRDSQVSAYTRQILHGLKYLHEKNVVHRDIKCANILVDANGLVKLADFGLAKATKLNDVNSCKGTAFWMAPEVVRSMGYGLAADIWSLGCTVLEMLTRRFPYSNLECMPALFKIGKGERPLIPDSLSNDARDFILKCLQVNPCLRPTAAQLLDHPFVKPPLPSSLGFTSSPYFARPN